MVLANGTFGEAFPWGLFNYLPKCVSTPKTRTRDVTTVDGSGKREVATGVQLTLGVIEERGYKVK